MSLLKKTLETNCLDYPIGINILDNLQNETALDNFENCYKDLIKVNEDFKITLSIEENIISNLNNESALTECLSNYGYLTNENADKIKNVGEQALREIKEMVIRMVEKFLGLFSKLKEYLIKFFDTNNILIKSLYKKIDGLGESKKVYSLDHEEFNHHLPLVKDFGNNTEITNMLNLLATAASNLKSYGTQAALFSSPHFASNQKDLIECSKNRITTLISESGGKLKLQIENVKFKESDLKSRLLSKSNLTSMLNKIETFNKLMKKYIDDLNFVTKKLEDVKGVKSDGILTHPHLSNNIRVTLEANGKFSNNIIHVTKGVLFVIASNIKCYENK